MSVKAIAPIIVLLMFLVGAWLYPSLPPQIATHWGISGQADGYMSKPWGIFLLPIVALVILFLFQLFPKIDPFKENISSFKNSYESFIALIIAFLAYVQGILLAWNLGYEINMNIAMPPAMALLFYYCGVLISKSKRNWFIGIRTPWTLSSDDVWNETHRLGGKLFKSAAVISLIGSFIPRYSFYFVIVPVICAAIYATVFSYFSYQKFSKQKPR